MPSDDLERRRRDELDRPPMAWLPIVVIGGLVTSTLLTLLLLPVLFRRFGLPAR